MMKKKMLGRSLAARGAAVLAAAGLLGLPGCDDVPQFAPLDSTMVLVANPNFIPANGGVSVITAIVTEPAGTPVPDGTTVQFFASLGRIDRDARTSGGAARVNFVSDTRSGVATITAVSGAVTAGVDGGISIGGVLPARMIVIADPSRITDSRSTHIIATVLDGDGNPVPNIGVIFTVGASTTEFMDSQGHPIFTDNNGRAEDVLRTRRSTSGSVTVNVVTFDGTTGSVVVPIVFQ